MCGFAEALEADYFQVSRDDGVQRGWRPRLLGLDLKQRFLQRFAEKRRPPGKQVVKDCAEAIHVTRHASVVADDQVVPS